ncbi:MAG: ATPase domain-containing protein [Rubrivivax sp.]|nr:ATPase domain-containing protein [Rubrivivax sp.]
MNAQVKILSLATGVPGLDTVLGGGLPELSFNLIAGPPGSGKTTLAHQIMFALATPERPALYFTVLGEPPMKMLRYQQQFGFFDSTAVGQRVHFVNLSDDALHGDADRLLARIADEVAAHGPALVFVDSFRSVALVREAGGAALNALQLFLQQLGLLMTTWQATTFLIGEYADDDGGSPVFTVADGLLRLHQSVLRNSAVRKLEVRKMRGQAAMPGLHTFRIGAAGIEVFAPACAPPAAALENTTPPANAESPGQPPHLGGGVPAVLARAQMGVPGLDDMLGGGLPRGYSLLVAGPSGSGKSLLAAAFLAEGARNDEVGIIVAFEQRPNRARQPLVAGLVAQGRVVLLDSPAVDLSVDEVVSLLLAEIGRRSATRVVIDSLSGFEMALAPTFREDFRESLVSLVVALAGVGVTVLMTSELEDRYTDLRFSPYGTAFLTDAIIVQRYIELDSRLRRVMAVVKVRASAHDDTLREYRIDADGIAIGQPLPGHEGLLGGRPTRKREGGP